MIRNIELFFRGELWLHLVTMFFLMTVGIKLSLLLNINIPLWVLFLIPPIVALSWEAIWRYKKQKEIDYKDILFTIIGGYISILIQIPLN